MTYLERFQIWLAWKMPRGLAKWVAVRVMTMDCPGNPGERMVGEAMDAWLGKPA